MKEILADVGKIDKSVLEEIIKLAEKAMLGPVRGESKEAMKEPSVQALEVSIEKEPLEKEEGDEMEGEEKDSEEEISEDELSLLEEEFLKRKK